jgi:hypothetical protein
MKYAYTVTLQWVVGGRAQQTSTRQGTITMPSGATRSQFTAVAFLAAAAVAALAACSPSQAASHAAARNASDCLAAVSGVIRSAPPSANDPATGPWLGQVDHLRDQARAAGDVTSRLLATELDYAGARVALDGMPPQLAIVPAKDTCASGSLSSQFADASVIAPARAWLRANPPAPRVGMVAAIITGWTDAGTDCPAASHGSAVARGGGCEAWSLTLTTATGTWHASCGDVAAGVACASVTAQPGPQQYFPGVGDELYVPDGGMVTGTYDIAIISQPPWSTWSRGH